ncbi:unnamed protein product [Brugia pahangi]|uniref:Uncharacterized protein n=1 Tax=Brugia pahangi TaxID=6280 RepID=A0A0N4T5S8_BRUPA|nr:unnamed protein product [Brugia pahangi]
MKTVGREHNNRQHFIWESDQNRTRRTQCADALPIEPHPLDLFREPFQAMEDFFGKSEQNQTSRTQQYHKPTLYQLSYINQSVVSLIHKYKKKATKKVNGLFKQLTIDSFTSDCVVPLIKQLQKQFHY